MKTGGIKIQLSAMMFIQFFIWGTWFITLGQYLGNTLNFSAGQIGTAFGMAAIASIISPFIVGMIADRYFSANRVMAFLNFAGAALLFWLSTIKTPGLFTAILLLYAICFMPTTALANSISFANLKNPEKEFSYIRLLGSFGWIVAGITLSRLQIEDSNMLFIVAAIASAAAGFIVLTLPYMAPKKTAEKKSFIQILGLDAFSLMKERSFFLLLLFSVLVCIPLSFYDAWTSPFLNESGVTMTAQSIITGQVVEIICMLVFPIVFAKLFYKGSISAAILVWIVLYGLFTLGSYTGNNTFLLSALPLHGFCFTFFFVTGQLFVEKKAPASLKNSAQGLIAFATYGVGKWLGAEISGVVVQHYTLPEGGHDWLSIWIVPLSIITIVFIGFIIFFKEGKKETKTA